MSGPALPPKVPILGTPISATSYDEVLAAIAARAPDRPLRIAFCNVHSVMSARADPRLCAALADVEIATPDGMPLVWALDAKGWPIRDRVYGPTLFEMALDRGRDLGWRHYFFGTTDGTLTRLAGALRRGRAGPSSGAAGPSPAAAITSTAEAHGGGRDLARPHRAHYVGRVERGDALSSHLVGLELP